MKQVEFRVERFQETVVERERGYLPCERTRDCQRLVKITPTFLGSFREVLDVEETPEHVMISLGCCGDTGGWRSKFARHIDAQTQ